MAHHRDRAAGAFLAALLLAVSPAAAADRWSWSTWRPEVGPMTPFVHGTTAAVEGVDAAYRDCGVSAPDATGAMTDGHCRSGDGPWRAAGWSSDLWEGTDPYRAIAGSGPTDGEDDEAWPAARVVADGSVHVGGTPPVSDGQVAAFLDSHYRTGLDDRRLDLLYGDVTCDGAADAVVGYLEEDTPDGPFYAVSVLTNFGGEAFPSTIRFGFGGVADDQLCGVPRPVGLAFEDFDDEATMTLAGEGACWRAIRVMDDMCDATPGLLQRQLSGTGPPHLGPPLILLADRETVR